MHLRVKNKELKRMRRLKNKFFMEYCGISSELLVKVGRDNRECSGVCPEMCYKPSG